jgi:quercetin dioxygenase-like cupin family protein
MREIRTFELDHGEPPAAWRVTQALELKVMAGEVWLTVQGDLRDYWLSSGETFELKRGDRAWVSAGANGARLTLAELRTPQCIARAAGSGDRPRSVPLHGQSSPPRGRPRTA